MVILITYTFLSNMISSTQTLAQITSIYWPHKTKLYDNMSSHICHQWHSRFCEMLYQNLGALQPNKMLFGRSHPITTTKSAMFLFNHGNHITVNKLSGEGIKPG